MGGGMGEGGVVVGGEEAGEGGAQQKKTHCVFGTDGLVTQSKGVIYKFTGCSLPGGE